MIYVPLQTRLLDLFPGTALGGYSYSRVPWVPRWDGALGGVSLVVRGKTGPRKVVDVGG